MVGNEGPIDVSRYNASPAGLNLSAGSVELPKGGAEVKGSGANLFDRQMSLQENQATWGNWLTLGNGIASGIDSAVSKSLGFMLMKNAMSKQFELASLDFNLKGRLVDVQDHLIGSQEKVAIQGMKTTERVAELTKERDIALGKTRADAAVKIAKVNALNSHFFGQPNQLPSWTT